jgi:hypothetical protein
MSAGHHHDAAAAVHGPRIPAAVHRRLSSEGDPVTAEHLVPKAKFPVIDYHAHVQGQLQTPEALAGLIAQLDKLNVRLALGCGQHFR